VPHDTTIDEVMAKVEDTNSPVGVVENGALVGQVTPDTVLKRLLASKAATRT